MLHSAKSTIISISPTVKTQTLTLKSGEKYLLSPTDTSSKKLIIKKSGEDMLLYEAGNDIPIYELKEGYAENISVDLSGLPHYADASAAAGSAVVSDAVAGGGVAAVAGSGLSTMSIVGLGALGAGGIAVAAGSGGGNSSTPIAPVIPPPSSDTTAPVITSGTTATTIDENSGAGAVIYTAIATDSSTITYSLKNTGDASLLSINATTGAVTLIANPDYESKSSYSFTVIATDSANNASEQTISLAINDLDEVAPTFTSSTSATTLENVSTSTVVYDAQADNDVDVTYSFLTSGGADYTLFDINSATGEVTFKVSPDYEIPTDSGANNIYDFTVRATDGAGNITDQAIVLSISDVAEAGQSVIDLGGYGKLIAPVQVNGNWYYHWDLSGDGTSANTGSLNGGVDKTDHDFLDSFLNHDINGVINTTVANTDGAYGTTNDYRYATINGVHVALPTSGTGNADETSSGNLNDDRAFYTDLADIWDSFNMGYQTSGIPVGWQNGTYLSATPKHAVGHSNVLLSDGYVDYFNDFFVGYVALQVL